MKFKITSVNLIYVILIQIILINIILGVLIVKGIKQKELLQSESAMPISYPIIDQKYNKNDFINNIIKQSNISNLNLSLKSDSNTKEFVATAYDLSYESCGKESTHPEYGITFSGTKATKGKTIAVDPEIIPLGSKVYIEFPERYTKLNGWYIAEDTGSKIKGNIIDVFFGESAQKEAMEFGRRKVKIRVLSP